MGTAANCSDQAGYSTMAAVPIFRARIWLVVGVIAGAVFFLHAGAFLIAQDPIDHAELALVLSGDPIRRALAARDLYRQGLVDRVVVIPEPVEPTQDELVRLGLVDPHLPPMSERILTASGVPRDRIAFLPAPADGTITEAVRARRFFGDRRPASLALVTSPCASRRARWIFRTLFARDGVRILSSPSPYDTFQAQRWWSKPRNALNVVMVEYQKLLTNGLQLLLGLYER